MTDSFELRLSFLVVVLLSVVYVGYEIVAIPSGGHPFGHSLGIIGAFLMLMTEFLYSARKRWRILQFGRIRSWLSFHIFTGIVGPFLVLMHTGLEFRGLAGLSMVLTVIVVLSGFVGRYIYTAVPRSLAGAELGRRELESELQEKNNELATWSLGKSERVQALVLQYSRNQPLASDSTSLEVLMRRYREWQAGRRLKSSMRAIESEERMRIKELEGMLAEQQRLVRQIGSLKAARKLLGTWHRLHIPVGLTLFVSMIIHITAALYYGGL